MLKRKNTILKSVSLTLTLTIFNFCR